MGKIESFTKFKLNSIRIYLTENCNANCSHCFNAKIREPKNMDIETTKKMFNYLKNNEFEHLKMMGGEPTIHPDFGEAYISAQENFQTVDLFTNALNDELLKIAPRKEDSIVYNFVFINNNFNEKKLLPDYIDFQRVFEIVVGNHTDMEDLFFRIESIYNRCLSLDIPKENIAFQLTLNCVENIFEHQEELNNKFVDAIKFIINLNPASLSFDHNYPYCFWTSSTRSLLEKCQLKVMYSSCYGKAVGLIDSEFNLLHCNQYPVKLINMLDKNNTNNNGFINYHILLNSLIKANIEKRLINYNKGCGNCKYFYNPCTGACFMHKDFIPGYTEAYKAENFVIS